MKDPDQARDFIDSLVRAMGSRVWRLEREKKQDIDLNDTSMQKEWYGDRWTLIYGIRSGMHTFLRGRISEYDFEEDEYINHGISEDSWEEHYEQYGYGAYGRGLEIGKRLAVYQDTDFEFVEPEEKEENESKFTFVR